MKKGLQHRYFPVNIAKILRTAFFIEHLWWLLLEVVLIRDYLELLHMEATMEFEV